MTKTPIRPFNSTCATHSRAARSAHALAVIGLLALAGTLATTAALRDSDTFDETSHLTAGAVYLTRGDFRFAPDHPPLAKYWCAAPLLLLHPHWPNADTPAGREALQAWDEAAVFQYGRPWLFQLNDGQRFLVVGRCMMVVVLLATCLATWALARRLFGPAAGLLALALAALSPAMLAHGHLVTTDMPITLCVVLSLLTFARLMEQMNWPRLLAAGAALAAAAVTKMSWPLLLPAILVMAVAALWPSRPVPAAADEYAGGPAPRADSGAGQASLPAPSKAAQQDEPEDSVRRRVPLVLGSLMFLGLFVWAGIWVAYGGHATVLAPPPASADPNQADAELARARLELAVLWNLALADPDGRPATGILPTLLRAAAEKAVLPEAYLLGFAGARLGTHNRAGYFWGECSRRGWWGYFPVAFALKTPLALLAFIVAGVLTVAARRAPVRDRVLLLGVIAFGLFYCGMAITGSINLGERHLLPVYPLLYAFGGAAAAWAARRMGQVLICLGLAGLAYASAAIHPQYLAYFNELAGGPLNGPRYLVDSNLDWGQDLLRLADYQQRHPGESLKLAYFGSALPTFYLDCRSLPGYYDWGPRAPLTAGTYVLSETLRAGAYDEEMRPDWWTPERRAAYVTEAFLAAGAPSLDPRIDRREALREYRDMRYKRLIANLHNRTPDERVGYTLRIYRLSDADIAALTAP